MEMEEPVQAGAVEDQRVERRKQGAGVDSSGKRSIGVEVRRLSPALDFDGLNFACGDEFWRRGLQSARLRR